MGEGGAWTLARLIRALARVDEVSAIRLHHLAPQRTWKMSLIAAHGDEPKLMPNLHLPVQSGSDRILKAFEPQASRRKVTCA